MLAKQATLFLLDAVPGNLNEAIKARQFIPPGAHDKASSGFIFASPDCGTFARVAGNYIEFKLRTDTKILPSSVVNSEAKKKAEAIEQQQGYKVGRKQMKEIKEAVLLDLLAKSHIKTAVTRGWFDTEANLLVIDSASAGKVDAVLSALAGAVDGLQIKPFRTKEAPEGAMTAWVRSEPPPCLDIDDRVKLRDTEGGKVTVVERSATSQEVLQLIDSGAVVQELAVTLDGAYSFVMAGSVIKRLEILNLTEQPGEPLTAEEEQAANLILSGAAVNAIFGFMVGELGGLAD